MNKKETGFTLVELLVVISVLGIMAVMALQIFLSLIRSSTKTEVLGRVKQNGDYALSVMERMIRNSREILECDTDHILIKNPDGRESNFRFCGDPDFLIASESGDLECGEVRLTSDQVRLASGAFSCTAGGEFQPDVVGISFTLSQSEETTRAEETVSLGFQGSVTTRNY